MPSDLDDSMPNLLHIALMGGHAEIAQVLIEHGADVNAQGFYKSTPLHLASSGGHVEITRALIERGAGVNAQDDYKSTPLHRASSPTRNALTLCGEIRCLLIWSAKTDAKGRQLICLVGEFPMCQQKLMLRGAS